jgi:Ser/Thr protein kinase RdoA (MazF antagonist)
MNNALYRVETEDGAFACKLCVDDERRRAQREVFALQLLERLGKDLAPRPVGLDESRRLAPYPAVVYTWLDGNPLGRSANARQLEALCDALKTLHSIRPDGDPGWPEAWFHWFDRKQYLDELYRFLESYREWLVTRVTGGVELYRRLARLVEASVRSVTQRSVDISRDAVPLRLCHVDPNPANLIWGTDERLRWVDWEYSGWGDPALDLAEYRWHERWMGLREVDHAWLRNHYSPPEGDVEFWERVALWDCLLSCRWPFLILRWLWSVYNGPERLRLTMHEIRVSELRGKLERLLRRGERINHC